MRLSAHRIVKIAFCCLVLAVASAAMAQTHYASSRLVSDLAGKAKHTDPLLKNPWGLAYAPGAPFWISDEASGWSTLYDGTGTPQTLQVIVPPASGTGSGTPTGIVYNGSTEFKIDSWTSLFLFATLDGTISGWSHFNPGSSLIAVHEAGASFTGLAITSHTSGNFLYAADAANNKVDIFDANFNLVKSFTDTTIPVGFSVFGIQDIGGNVFVTFANTSGKGGGFIDIFKEDGTFVKRFTHGTPLNQPWGMAVAPTNFGPASGLLLVSNNTKSGTINGFNMTTGAFVTALKNSLGNTITINGLWGIEFGGGTTANGATNALYFTAGPSDTDGYFGVITAH